MVTNNAALREEVDLLEEKRLKASLTSANVQQTTTSRYKCHVRHKEFPPWDLVLRRTDIRDENA